MKQYHIVIVEDSKPDAALLQRALEKKFPQLIVDALAPDVPKAIAAIDKHRPSIIFLDVELGSRKGFEVLDALRHLNFEVIFTTAHTKYLLDALRASAADFLQKPYSDDELKQAAERAIAKVELQVKQNVNEQLEKILHCINAPMMLNARLRLTNMEGIHTVAAADIVYAEAQSNRTVFHLVNGKEIAVSKTLNTFDELLEPFGLVRIQQSFIINLNHIAIYKKKGGDVIMRGYENKELAISRDKRNWFDSLYNGFTIGA